MNLKYTVDDLMASARKFKTIGEWRRADKQRYEQAVRRGLMPEVRKFLTAEVGGPVAAYTDTELAADARRFATRAEWEAAGQAEMAQGQISHYHCALGRGPVFFAKYCQHMEQRRRWTDDEIIAVALKYQHKGDWKRSPDRLDSAAYQTALMRPEVFARATAHMTPKAHPYSGSYTVYAYEFADHHAYVGLTFLPRTRHALHMQRGPVHDHIKTCADYAYKTLEDGISGPDVVGAIEQRWLDQYRAAGWVMLNERQGGGLGTVQVTKWTKEAVMAEARKYKTKQEWIDNSQMSYRIAKREGWFDEASAHMPKRVRGVGLGGKASPEAREKQRQAKLGQSQSAAHRAARSEATRRWWAARRTGSQAESIVDKLLDLQ